MRPPPSGVTSRMPVSARSIAIWLASLLTQLFVYSIAALSAIAILWRIVEFRLPAHIDLWLASYDQRISELTDLIFGWTRVSWLGITQEEGHILVIGGATIFAMARSALAYDRACVRPNNSPRRAWIIPLLFVMFFLFIVLLPLLVMPGIWGTLITALNIAVLGYTICRKSAI